MKRTTALDLVAWSLPVFLVVFFGFDLWLRDGGVAILVHPLAFLGPLLLAAVILWLAWGVHRYQKGKKRIDPLFAARIALLSQGGSRVGALMAAAGAAVTLAYYRTQNLSIWEIGLASLAALVLMLASLLAEKWCSVDPPSPETAGDTAGAAA